MLVLNKKTIDLLHSKICSIFVIEIFEIMQRNAMCSKTFVTNVLPIIFDFSPYFLIFKKIKSITQISFVNIYVLNLISSGCEKKYYPFIERQLFCGIRYISSLCRSVPFPRQPISYMYFFKSYCMITVSFNRLIRRQHLPLSLSL